MTQRHVVVIGAGVGGLSAAWDLLKAGHRVTVLEAGEQVGGLAGGFQAPHWSWSLERFYHHWFASDRHMLGLIRELGWSDDVIFERPYTVVYDDGGFHPLDSYREAARFMLRRFGLLDVIRFGLVGLYLRLTPRWRALEQVTADAWMRRWAGERVYRALWRPMLAGKFGEENLDVVNMAWLWARLHTRTTRLGSFAGGFQAFLDRFAMAVREKGGEIRLASWAAAVEPFPDGSLFVIEAGGDRLQADAVISTLSPAATASLVPALPGEYAENLRSLRSLGALVLVLALREKLTPYYWHNLPKDEGFPFLALVEHTNFLPPEHYGGDHIVYCGDYLPADHEWMRLSEEELLELFLPTLKRVNPSFERAWVKQTWLWRTTYGQPVPPVNHSRHVPDLRTPLEGLYVASMSQVYPWDRGTNFAVELGRRVAKLVAEDLHARTD